MIDKKDECINNVPTWMFIEYLCISTSQVLKLGNWKIDIILHAQIYIYCIYACKYDGFLTLGIKLGKIQCLWVMSK